MANFGRLYSHDNASGLLGYFVRNECDISLSYDEFRYDAFEYVDYTSVILRNEEKIFSGKPIKQQSHAFDVLRVFDKEVWLFLLCSLLLISTIRTLTETGKWRLPLHDYFDHLHNVIGLLLLQGSSAAMKSVAVRMYWALWLLSFFCLSSIFSSKFLSFMALPDTMKYYETLEDLAQFNEHNMRIVKETPPHYFFLAADTKMKKKVYNDIVKKGGFFNILKVNAIEEFENLNDGVATTLLDKVSVYNVLALLGMCGEDFHLHISTKPIFLMTVALPMRKRFDTHFSRRWKLMVAYFFEGGNFDRVLQNTLIRKTKCAQVFHDPQIHDVSSLSISNILLLITVWTLGIAISVISHILKCCAF